MRAQQMYLRPRRLSGDRDRFVAGGADLVIGGWRAHAAIVEAIRKSRDEPGVDQVVPLRDHTITANRGHDLDVEVDGFQVLTLSAELVVKLQLFDAVAVLRARVALTGALSRSENDSLPSNSVSPNTPTRTI